MLQKKSEETPCKVEGIHTRNFDGMRQYVAADHTVTLHALDILADLAQATSHPAMADACVQQIHRLARSAKELLSESVAHDEIERKLSSALDAIDAQRRASRKADC